jgi:hypothetical protein
LRPSYEVFCFLRNDFEAVYSFEDALRGAIELASLWVENEDGLPASAALVGAAD